MSTREIVEAGAGCGKTYGLVTRYLAALGLQRDANVNVRERRYKTTSPNKILTLTFTTDAADEMRHRIIEALREANRSDLCAQVEDQGRISTFHSFCYRILKPHLLELGYSGGDILSEVESQAHKMEHILSILAKSPHSEDVQKLFDLRKIVKFCASNWRRPSREIAEEIQNIYQDIQTHTQTWVQETIHEFELAATSRPDFLENAEAWPYQTYEALKDGNWSALASVAFNKNYKKWWSESFPNLIARAQTARDFSKKQLYRYLDKELCKSETQCFAKIFEFLNEVQASAPKLLDFDALESETLAFLKNNTDKIPRYDLLIVDEFQDTNRRQVEILDILCHEATELYYVGDPKQAIYSFRGGDVRVFNAQKKSLTQSSLEINRRSLPAVLSFMNELTKNTFVHEDDPFAQTLQPCEAKIVQAQSDISRVVITQTPDKKSSFFWDALAQDLLEGQSSGPTSQAVLCQKWRSAFTAFEELRRRGVRVSLGNDLDMSAHHLSALWIAYLQSIDGNLSAKNHWNHLARTWNLTPLPETTESQSKEQDPRSWLRKFVNAVSPKRWPQGILWLASMETWIQNHGAQWRWVPSAQELASSFKKSMNLRLNLEAPKNPLTELSDEDPKDQVIITTIHKSKGLQYQNVYLFDLFDGERRGAGFQVTDADEDENLESFHIKTSDGQPMPSLYYKIKKTTEDQRLAAEKKRLFYVAYTRAENQLYFYVNGQALSKKPSEMSLESQIWKWPNSDSLSWNRVVQKVAQSVHGDHIVHRDLSNDPTLVVTSHSEASTEIPSEITTDQWSLPAPRENTAALSSEKTFLRAGARTYIDDVLFADQKTSFEAFANAPRATRKNEDDPANWKNIGSSLHKILETWDGKTDNLSEILKNFEEVQHPHLKNALQSLATFSDLQSLWLDIQKYPQRVQREVGLFIHGDEYRLSGFADLVWYPVPGKAIILDWKSSSNERSAFDATKIAKTEAQVGLYAQSLEPMFDQIEIWSLAVIFDPKIELRWLFKKAHSFRGASAV